MVSGYNKQSHTCNEMHYHPTVNIIDYPGVLNWSWIVFSLFHKLRLHFFPNTHTARLLRWKIRFRMPTRPNYCNYVNVNSGISLSFYPVHALTMIYLMTQLTSTQSNWKSSLALPPLLRQRQRSNQSNLSFCLTEMKLIYSSVDTILKVFAVEKRVAAYARSTIQSTRKRVKFEKSTSMLVNIRHI